MEEQSLVSVSAYINGHEKGLINVPFSSGFSHVDEYLKNEAEYDSENNLAETSLFVLDNKVVAFVSSSVGQLDVENRHDKDFKNADKNWPVLFLHELGVDENYQRLLIGTSLLLETYKRVLNIRHELQLGIAGIVLHAKPDDTVIKFYLKNGFKFIEEKDEIDFGTGEDAGFFPNRYDVIPMYITIVGIEEQLSLYE
jgi:ribosomal protein S18 acetylase RimI-like enzyme